MIDKAMHTIYSNSERLCTPEGLFNVLMYRGVFYGSLYATNELKWFNSYQEWESFYSSSTRQKKGNKEAYYVNVNAYGCNNKSRSIVNIVSYWDECYRWPSFLHGNPNIKEVYNFLIMMEDKKKIFKNIGPLTALLVCGDLVESGVLVLPTNEDWASLIYIVEKGGTRGLQRILLLEEKFSQQDVIDAFQMLNAFLVQEISTSDRELMGYNIVMLEHALCKFTRVVKEKKKTTSDNAATGKKRKRK